VLQPGRVIRVTFLVGHPGLTCFIKYPGLTQILHWITCVINGIGSDRLTMPEGDDVTISPQNIRYFKMGDCWRLYSNEEKECKGK